MEVTTSKILAMLLLGGVSIILGFIPLKLGKWFKSSDGSPRHGTIFSSLLCFGGGVLLATSLLHMLPEVRENFENAGVPPEGHEHIPLAEIILMLGFFLIYFIEEFVHFMCDSQLHSDDDEQNEIVEEVVSKRRKQSVGVHRAFSVHSLSCEHIDTQVKENSDDKILGITTSRKNILKEVPVVKEIKDLRGDEMVQGSLPSNLNFHSSTDYQTFERGNNKNPRLVQSNDNHVHHSHQENSLQVTNGRKIALRDFFTVLALSFHAVFEGLAIGLEPDSADIWILFAAVASHKYVISFCVGLELYNADTPKVLYASYMLVYALMSSIGIAIGIAVTTAVENDTTSYLMSVGILQALAGGTILYVVVFEVLQREKCKEKVPGLVQLLCVILGFSALMMVEILAPHDHGEEQGNVNVTTPNIFNSTFTIPGM